MTAEMITAPNEKISVPAFLASPVYKSEDLQWLFTALIANTGAKVDCICRHGSKPFQGIQYFTSFREALLQVSWIIDGSAPDSLDPRVHTLMVFDMPEGPSLEWKVKLPSWDISFNITPGYPLEMFR